MNTYITFAMRCWAFSMIFLLSSCESFLDVIAKDQVTDGVVWDNVNNADLFLNDVYGGIPGPHNTSDPWENFSDNSMNGVSGMTSRALYGPSVYTASNGPNQWGLYSVIRRANLFIERVTTAQLPDDWKKERLPEARFLRAYYYMLLWTSHGGVPLITEVLNQEVHGEGIFRPRQSAEDTYNFLISEFAEIALTLPEKPEAGRATRGAALAMKAYCELFWASPLYNPTNQKERWDAAAATYKQIIDSKTYSLFPDYGAMFLENNNDNPEAIFVKQYAGGTNLGGSREGFLGPWAVHGIGRTWGGVNPTQELVDEYSMANGLPITHPESGYNPQDPYRNRERRFYQTIIYDGAVWLDDTIIVKQGVGSMNATDLSNFNESTNTGYYLRKGMNPEYALISGNNRLSSANFIISRYAEVLLGYAESRNESSGPDASVHEAINQVRARSGLPPVNEGLSQAEMRDVIYRERRVELAFEEKRWYDLLRLKLAEKVLNGDLHAMLISRQNGSWVHQVIPAPDGKRVFYPDKNYLLPIPQAAINTNSELVQNPNY